MIHSNPSRRALLAGMAAAPAFAASRSNDPAQWTLAQASASLSARKISSEELTRACLTRIHRFDKSLNAFITLTEEAALEQARRSDEKRRSQIRISPLYGIPIALKDNIDTAGLLTTAASRVFAARIPRKTLKSLGV